MSGPGQPWWAKPGGAPPTPGAGRPRATPPRSGGPYRNPAPAGTPRPAPNPYGPPRQGPPRQAPPRRQPAPDPYSAYDSHPIHGYGAAPQPKPSPKPNKGRWLLPAGIAACVVLLIALGLGVWKLGMPGGTVLDVHEAEAGVARILSDPIYGYGSNNVEAVACNNGKNPDAAKGKAFTCAVEIDGAIRHVNVEFTDDAGTYAVDGPR